MLDRLGISKRNNSSFSTKGGSVPYGKKLTDGKLTDHAREQLVIQRIVRLKQQGLSYSAIARSLTASGIKTKNDGKWHHETVKQILLRELSPDLPLFPAYV